MVEDSYVYGCKQSMTKAATILHRDDELWRADTRASFRFFSLSDGFRGSSKFTWNSPKPIQKMEEPILQVADKKGIDILSKIGIQ